MSQQEASGTCETSTTYGVPLVKYRPFSPPLSPSFSSSLAHCRGRPHRDLKRAQCPPLPSVIRPSILNCARNGVRSVHRVVCVCVGFSSRATGVCGLTRGKLKVLSPSALWGPRDASVKVLSSLSTDQPGLIRQSN